MSEKVFTLVLVSANNASMHKKIYGGKLRTMGVHNGRFDPPSWPKFSEKHTLRLVGVESLKENDLQDWPGLSTLVAAVRGRGLEVVVVRNGGGFWTEENPGQVWISTGAAQSAKSQPIGVMDCQ